ncbi:hypothetical protein MTR67_051917 [Solanum verrucosum]|uniref:Uncharacterized protein n=1 Tax=Solanum verrucosum TaxID=315347 RepID=A0AAF0ZZI4_SOLVR|nr:hypothetical protein MTR67_051917 [Solanum verrucosum]
MQLPKLSGGLGVRNLRILNECLLMKWLWRYVEEEQALWREVIHHKYGRDSQWCTNEVGFESRVMGDYPARFGLGAPLAQWEASKLKALKFKPKEWRKGDTGNLGNQRKVLLEQIAVMDAEREDRILTEEEIPKKAEFTLEY